MTDKQFHTLFTAALGDGNREAFVSAWALSPIWGDPEGVDVPAARIDELVELWDAAHLTIRDIRVRAGMTQAAFAERFLIPRRTIENWEGDKRECPAYLRLMLAELSGAYARRGGKVCVICGGIVPSVTPAVTCAPECAAENRRWKQAAAEARRKARNPE